jgi:hypothetical protein
MEKLWDIVNTLRIAEMGEAPVFGLATDDSHEYFGRGGSPPGRGWIQVRARFLTPEAIIRAISMGDFYASSGVALKQVRFDPSRRRIELEIEEQPGATYTTQFIGTLEDYDPARSPAADPKTLAGTMPHHYSDDVGKVLATVEGPKAAYDLTGKELYVRAVVTSSLPPENPSFKDQKAQAWTQPVGWIPRVFRASMFPRVGPPWPPPRRSGPSQPAAEPAPAPVPAPDAKSERPGEG